jgi:4-amino-4-deoxy-L-arabinose transferase-like glycosyltransferase
MAANPLLLNRQLDDSARAHYAPALLAVLVFAAVLRWLFANGPLGSDDLVYLARSVEIAQGNWTPANYNGALRYGFNIPEAMFLRVFGIDAVTANLWPMVCSLAEIAAVFVFAWHAWGRRHAVLAACILATLPLHIASATRIHADPVVSCFLTLTFVLFFLAERKGSKALYFAAGLAIGMVYWVKELAIVTLLALAMYPLVWRKLRTVWLYFVAGGLVMLVAHLVLMTVVAGDPWHLVKVVTGQISRSYLGQMNGEDAPFYYFKYLFLDVRHTWLAAFLAVAGLAWWVLDRRRGRVAAGGAQPEATAYTVFWLVALIGVLSFLPVSLSPFRLTMKQSNYLTLFLAPLSVLAACAVARLRAGWQSPVLALTLLGGVVLGALQQQAYRVFTSNSVALVEFMKQHPQARVLGFTNNGNMVHVMSILQHDGALRERFGYLNEMSEAEVLDGVAAHPASDWYAVFDRETMEWVSRPTRWNAPLPCWRKVADLEPGGFGYGRYVPLALVAVAQHVPGSIGARLQPPLERLVAPRPATLVLIPQGDPLCRANGTPAAR